MTAAPSAYRIQPGPSVALLVVVAYSVIVIGTLAASGVAYTELFDSAENAWKSVVLALALGSLFLIAFVSYVRWDFVWRDAGRLPMSKLIWLPAIVMVLGFLVRFAGIDWGAVDGSLLAAIVVAGIGVGFSEETLFRGIVLRCMRTGGRTEAHAALVTAVGFGLFHLSNVVVGAGAAVVVQVFLATMSGFALYLWRRGTGAIFVAMAVHGLWDMSAFLSGQSDLVNNDLPFNNLSNGLMLLNLFLIVAAFFATRRLDRQLRWQKSGAEIVPDAPIATS